MNSKLLSITNLKVGDILKDSEINEVFQCSPQKGIRTSTVNKTITLICKYIGNPPYPNRWINDILFYVGEGQNGDQKFTRGNKRIKESNETNFQIHVFEEFEEKKYTFSGQFYLYGEPIETKVNERTIIYFPLKRVENTPAISKNNIHKYEDIQYKTIQKLTKEQLFISAKSENEKINGFNTTYQEFVEEDGINYRIVSQKEYIRNPLISAASKELAEGVCQLCYQKAQFNDINGLPYLEAHHIDYLSEGGMDVLENVIALCPNCHTKVHVEDYKDNANDLKDELHRRAKSLAKRHGLLN